MAELGDFSSEIEGNDAPATVDMCDYGYVNECNDKKKLGGILRLLRSGKEGHYPEVIEYSNKYIPSLQDTRLVSILVVIIAFFKKRFPILNISSADKVHRRQTVDSDDPSGAAKDSQT
jgi:hypothetical protein